MICWKTGICIDAVRFFEFSDLWPNLVWRNIIPSSLYLLVILHKITFSAKLDNWLSFLSLVFFFLKHITKIVSFPSNTLPALSRFKYNYKTCNSCIHNFRCRSKLCYSSIYCVFYSTSKYPRHFNRSETYVQNAAEWLLSDY